MAESETYEEYDDPKEYPLVPGVDTTAKEFADRFVDYRERGPNDVMLSGPVNRKGWGPGRRYPSFTAAYEAACKRYGAERVFRVMGFQSGRWAFLIKNLKIQGPIAPGEPDAT